MSSSPQPLYFNDLKVGDLFKTGSHEVRTEHIRAFATEFDPQPFHLDEAAAARSFFGGLAASGWHTAAITMRLLVTEGPPLAGGIVGMGMELRWTAPCRPGDRLHVESEVLELSPSRSHPDRGVLLLSSKTVNQNGVVVQDLRAKLLVTRR